MFSPERFTFLADSPSLISSLERTSKSLRFDKMRYSPSATSPLEIKLKFLGFSHLSVTSIIS